MCIVTWVYQNAECAVAWLFNVLEHDSLSMLFLLIFQSRLTALESSLSAAEADRLQSSSEKGHWESLNKLLEAKVAELQEQINTLQVKQNQVR